MKTIKFFFLSLVLFTFSAYAQVTDSAPVVEKSVQVNNEKSAAINGIGNNELKINLAMCVAGLPEISYERYVAENMGLGISASFSVDNTQDYNAILLPYYRLYFGNKLKAAFFIEGNMAAVNEKSYYYEVANQFYYSQMTQQTSVTNFGFGVAAGVKFLTKNNFTGEVYLGAGRLFGNNTSGGFPRIGLIIAKRF